MNIGDLVYDSETGEETGIGIVIGIIRDIEIPPMIEVLWETGNISRTYSDELETVCV